MTHRCQALAVLPLTVLAAWLVAASAQAEEDVYTKSGFYTGMSAAMGVENFADNTGSTSVVPGFGMKLGYRANPYIATDIQFEYFREFRWDREPHDSVTIINTTANLRIIGPFGRYQPYALIGVGVYNASFRPKNNQFAPLDHTDGSARAGGGFDFYVTERVILNIEANYNFILNRRQKLDFFGGRMGVDLRF